MLPTFSYVGAVRLFANGVQPEFPHEILEAYVVFPSRRAHFEPGRLSLRKRLRAVAAKYLVKSILH